MGRMVDGAARIRLVLVILVSGAVALLVPSLSAANADVSSAVVLTAVAALVAAVVRPGRHPVTSVQGPLAGTIGSSEGAPSFLAARVTDTAHHPVRPRAPGPA